MLFSVRRDPAYDLISIIAREETTLRNSNGTGVSMKRTYLAGAVHQCLRDFGLVFIYSAGISMEARHPDVTASGF